MDQSRERRFLDIFHKVTSRTAMVLDHQEVMETIVRALPELLGIDACTIRLLDDALLFDRALESVIGNLRRLKNA